MDKNWILLHRSFLEWEWWDDDKMVKLFIYLLLKANHSDGNWKGIPIKRGQLVTGVNKLSDNTGISPQSLRTFIKRLQNTGEIKVQSTNKYSIVTLINYEVYQFSNDQTNKPPTNNEKATKNPSTTNKEEKKKKKEKEPPAKKAGDKVDPLFAPFRQIFEEKYRTISSTEYYWGPKDSTHINKLIKQVKHAYTSIGHDATDEEIEIAFGFMLDRALKDKWLSQNFEPAMISSKFNSLKSKGNDTTKKAVDSVRESIRRGIRNSDKAAEQ